MQIRERILLEENELKPNRYVANAVLFSLAAVAVVELLNEAGVFHVAYGSMRVSYLIVTVCSGLIQYIGRRRRISANPLTKYWVLSLVMLETLTVTTVVSQWTELLLALPILLAVQYHNRAVTRMSVAGTLLVALSCAPLSIWLRMPQLDYYDFQIRSIGYLAPQIVPNAEYNMGYFAMEVFKYVSLPRAIIISAFAPISFYITKLVEQNIHSRADAILYSTTDIMTGLYNRFSFEEKAGQYRKKAPGGLICVYADADGLRETNNQLGHEAGDALLRFCGSCMAEVFGEWTYRIGGDEFLAFLEGDTMESVAAAIGQMQAMLTPKGYHVSLGACQIREGETVDALIREAEGLMYAAKREYYSQDGKDRRKRR